jgi:tetratricopeptide (TPR) repeat protein
VLAARFALYTNELSTARNIAQKILGSNAANPSSVFEQDAQAVSYWCDIQEYASRYEDVSSAYTQSLKKRLVSLDAVVRNRLDQCDVDLLMAYVKAKQLLESHADSLNILNQVIAMYPWFVNALAEKCMMLASMRDWDQALDTAQRALDADRDNLDALHVIAVHAFTQESQLDDATQKFIDLDKAIQTKEPYNAHLARSIALLYAKICMRQPHVLDICVRALERAQKNVDTAEEEAEVLCAIGQIRSLQGSSQYTAAMKAFKESIKRDGNNFHALAGMVKCQLLDGQYEDAEAQIELLLVMHSADELGAEYHFNQAYLSRNLRHDMKEHLASLEQAKSSLLQTVAEESRLFYTPFQEIQAMNPDFSMMLAMEYLHQVQAAAFIPFANTSANAAAAAEEESKQAAQLQGGGMTMATINTGNTIAMTMMNLNTMRGGAGATLTMTSKPVKRLAAADDDMANTSPFASESSSSPALQSCMQILSKMLKVCPGHASIYIESARCLMMQGNYDDAARNLRQYLNIQPKSCPALIAMAKIDIQRQQTSAANRSLEQALAADFSIRSSTLFQMLQVYVKAQQTKYDEAIIEMEKLMSSPEIHGNSGSSQAVDSLGLPMTAVVNPLDPLRLMPEDRAGAFITYSYLLSKVKRLKEAKQVLAEAKMIFAGSEQEVQILVASSQLAVERKDYDAAIRMLDQIAPDSVAYSRAQTMKADILLTYHRDKEGYTECYKQLVAQDGSAKNYYALGEAYLRILQPESAVDALEAAYRLDPMVNSRLRTRIGRALIATHEYHRAIDFYESNIKELLRTAPSSSELISLSHDLAKLYRKLERYESATRILNQIMHPDSRDIAELRHDVVTLLLLSEVQAASATVTTKGVSKEYLSTLVHAKDIQREIVNMVRASTATASETIQEEKEMLSDICERLGLAYSMMADHSKSAAMYSDAIQYNSSNSGAILGQAKIYRHKGDIAACQAECQKVLHIDPSNSEAAIMLSELLFLTSSTAPTISSPVAASGKGNSSEVRGFDDIPDISDAPAVHSDGGKSLAGLKNPSSDMSASVKPLQDLLRSEPNNYHALEKMISLLRRAGRLTEVPSYLEAAAENDRRSSEHAGYHFCQGLYRRYTNDIGHAIAEFNLARRDDRWGQAALVHMIELYLNPDQEGIWEQDRPSDDHQSYSGEADEQIVQNLNAADTLLKELETKAK